MAIEELILAHAEEKKSRFANRMSLVELPAVDLPENLKHFSIVVDGVFDYLPMNYLLLGSDYYSSLNKEDFTRLLERFNFVESEQLTAREVAQIFLLIAFPSRGRFIVESLGDLNIPANMPIEVQNQLDEIIIPPALHRNPGLAQCAFYLYNGREGILEEVLLEVSSDYSINLIVQPIANLWAGQSE